MEDRRGEFPERWSAKWKSDIVLRLLRRENLRDLSREFQVPLPETERRGYTPKSVSGLLARSMTKPG